MKTSGESRACCHDVRLRWNLGRPGNHVYNLRRVVMTNTKGNEHPACGCQSCRRGARSKWGQHMHTTINRAIRRRNRAALKGIKDIDTYMARVVSTPYTD